METAVVSQGIGALDTVTLIIIAIFALRAALRGFVREFLAVATLLGGALAGMAFSGLLAGLIESWWGPSVFNQVLAFVVIFAVVFLLVLLLRNALTTIVEGFNLTILDHFLGFFLGIVEGLLLVFILIVVVSLLPNPEIKSFMTDSWTWTLLSPFLADAHALVDGVVSV